MQRAMRQALDQRHAWLPDVRSGLSLVATQAKVAAWPNITKMSRHRSDAMLSAGHRLLTLDIAKSEG